jgi:hypothetical protein
MAQSYIASIAAFAGGLIDACIFYVQKPVQAVLCVCIFVQILVCYSNLTTTAH